MVLGDLLGTAFPTSIEALLAQGPDFLTQAFHAAGSLDEDNRVVAINTSREVVLGGMGRKLELSVTYERPDCNLHNDLFIKFQRDFQDPLRAVFAPWMAPEIRFALFSRQPNFPITVPKCYFADFHADSLSGVLITERIAYGHDGIERSPTKAADYELADPLPRYRALTRAMARLAAHHRNGGFGGDVERAFPVIASGHGHGNGSTLTPETLREKMSALRDFAARYPQLFSDGLGDPDFLRSLSEDAEIFLQVEATISTYLVKQTDYFGLCHPNLNLDNAWFWTDAQGELQVGLLDWGNVGQIAFARAIIGMISCAETEFLRTHRDGLIQLFVDEFSSRSGVTIEAAKLAHLVKLTLPVLALPWIVEIPQLIERMTPDLVSVSDRFDPRIKNELVVRSQLQGLMVALSAWREGHFGDLWRAIAAGRPIDDLARGAP